MSFVYLDWETFSEEDLRDVGLDRYARHPSTGAHMLSWAIDDRKIQQWFPKNSRSLEGMPEELLSAILDPANLLIAWNAQFERVIFERVMGLVLTFERWRDPMVCARSFSLPGALDKVCEILQVPKEDAKADGDELIKFFCEPDPKRPKSVETLFGPVGRFREPSRFPEEWKKFCDYGRQDIHCERVLWKKFEGLSPIPEDEWKIWFLDQKMNEIGMPVNRKMVENGLWLAQESKRRLKSKLIGITGLENPLSDAQMKEWLSTRGYPWGTLLADYVKMELANAKSTLTPEARAALRIRQEANKRSYTKLERILELLGPDDRLRYQFRFGAAARTARWSGGDSQPQNLPRPIKAVKKNYQKIVDLILAKDYDTIERDYPSVINAVSSAIRMMFQAPPGKKVVVSDLNAIENRGLGYLARCPAILDVFKLGRCPYLSFAVFLFNMRYEVLEAEYNLYEETKGEKGDDQKRQQAKAPVLGGGYGLGIGKMETTEFGDEVWGGLMGYARKVCGIELPLEVAQKAIPALRKAWPEVVQYWKDCEEGFKHVFKTGKPIRIGEVTYRKTDGRWGWVPCETVVQGAVIEITRHKFYGKYLIRVKMPSGRFLHYLNVSIEEETVSGNDGKPWVREQIFYDGIEHSNTTGENGAREKKQHKWGRVKSYGGKFVENWVQSFCRDLLAYGMLLADDLGFEIFGLFHDEGAALVPDDPWGLGIHDFQWCMSQPPPYSPDMPLGAAGFESPFYKKG